MNNKLLKKGIHSCDYSEEKENDLVTTSRKSQKDFLVHVQFSVFLCSSDQFNEFETWLRDISRFSPSLVIDLNKNEEFCLCIVRLRFSQKKYKQVIQLLKSGPFSAKEDYVLLWEDAHYKQEEEEKGNGKPLTSIQRFRSRKKYPPPANICPFGRQIISPLFKEASVILKCWYAEHSDHPYPDAYEKALLARSTGLTLYQVKTWFANTRRRRKVRQMDSSLPHLMSNSSKALDFSDQDIERKADWEEAGPDSRESHIEEQECKSSTEMVNSLNDIKSKEPFDFLLSQKIFQEVNLPQNGDNSEHLVIPSSAPSSFLTSLTSSVEMAPDLTCQNSSIYSFPIYTTPVEPAVSLGALRHSFSHFFQLDQGIQNTKLPDNFSDSCMRSTEQGSYLAYQNPTPSYAADYPLSTPPCLAMETLGSMVACPLPTISNSHLVPLVNPSAKIVDNQILLASTNLQPSQMDNDGFNQAYRSCDKSPSTNHETLSLGTSTLQGPHSLNPDPLGSREDCLNIETEIAYTMLTLSRDGNLNPY